MHIKDIKLPSTWTAFSTLVDEVEAGTEYIITNSSPDTIYAIESAGVPDKKYIGIPVYSGNYIDYKKGVQDLYLRNAYTPVTSKGVAKENKVSNITISKVG